MELVGSPMRPSNHVQRQLISKSAIFWDVGSCGLLEVYLHVGGTRYFHLQDR
jgi:hypothetical protein